MRVLQRIGRIHGENAIAYKNYAGHLAEHRLQGIQSTVRELEFRPVFLQGEILGHGNAGGVEPRFSELAVADQQVGISGTQRRSRQQSDAGIRWRIFLID